jgi:peroxiredoxin
VAKAYGVLSGLIRYPKRWTFYISPKGQILYIDKKVKTDSHGKDCVAKLEELKVPKKR